jgi:hypothetical protein
MKGSNTKSPGFENASKICRAKEGEKRAGYLVKIVSQARYGLLILDCKQKVLPFWHSRQTAKSRPEQFQIYRLPPPASKTKLSIRAKHG